MVSITPIVGAWPTTLPGTGVMTLSGGGDIHISAVQSAGAANVTYDVIAWDGTRWTSQGTFVINSGVKGGTALLDARIGTSYIAVSVWTAADANSATLTVNGDNGNLWR